ncbi:MAG: hypothetical protein JXA81_10980 [Sedimentisphaerales bacterium]|nr:hypothetical protein [Sedimentisphaerales bacterium]
MSGEEFKMILEIINTLAIVIASIVAICGISAWRKEFQGKRNIELAEDVLALFYEAIDAIRAIRSPLGYLEEGATRKPQDGETPQQKQARDQAYVVRERYEKRQEVFNKLRSKRYQFKARFGTEKAKPFDDLNNIVIEIQVSADRLADIWSLDRRSDETEKRRLEYESVIWSRPENDNIAGRLDNVISDIERICRPIIKGSSN